MAPPTLQHVSFPNESAEYRRARNELLESEMRLRRMIEDVAAQRRALPPGGQLREDYVFEGIGSNGVPTSVKLSELFSPGKNTLAIYSFMYGPQRTSPCLGCTHMLDSLDRVALHASHRLNLFIVAKSPLARLLELARQREWKHLSFLSTAGNDFDRDYYGDTDGLSDAVRQQQGIKEDGDMPMLNVFQRDASIVRHCWGSELLYVPPEPGQQYRHNDLIDPLWALLDTTPEGRGQFEPQLSYRE
jgi:predicted dithiol-disulfide oxidoreductase (DUF899 family)